jgi:uncharacterized protein YggE
MTTKLAGLMAIVLIPVSFLVAWIPNQKTAEMSSEQLGAISVTGDAEVRVVPDEVIVTLGVETWDENLDVAKTENDLRVQRVIRLIQSCGVQRQHIQTEYISIEPHYRDEYAKNDFLGFFVRKTIVVTLRDVTRFEELLTGVLDEGVTHVHGIQFRTTELRKHRDEARALAIRAAREKAVALAGALGHEVGEPTSIYEDHIGWWSWYNSWWGTRWGGGMAQNVIQETGGSAWGEDDALSPGQISVRARVTVSFRLE